MFRQLLRHKNSLEKLGIQILRRLFCLIFLFLLVLELEKGGQILEQSNPLLHIIKRVKALKEAILHHGLRGRFPFRGRL